MEEVGKGKEGEVSEERWDVNSGEVSEERWERNSGKERGGEGMR